MASLSIFPEGITSADDDGVRIGEELNFPTLEAFQADSRRMGERNREAREQASAAGKPHYWHEQFRRDDAGRMWRVRVRTTFAELRHQEELQQLAKRHGAVFEDDDGTTVTGAEAIAAVNARIDEQQQLRQRFARERPQDWARYCQAKGYVDAPLISSPQGRAARVATNEHRRGSRRGERPRSASSDDPDGDPEPRICEWCGAPIENRRADARHCSDSHRARAHRRVRAERELVRDAAQFSPATQTTAPCDCAECARARNGHYLVDPEVLAVWIEQIEDCRDSEPRGLTWPPRLTNGTEPIVVITADGERTEFSPQAWRRHVRHLHTKERAPAATGAQKGRTNEFSNRTNTTG